MAKGTTTILVMARDIEGLTISQTIIVTVDAAPNRVPTPVGTVAPVRLTAGDSSISVDVSHYFSDPDSDPDNDLLTYTVVFNDTRVVTVSEVEGAIHRVNLKPFLKSITAHKNIVKRGSNDY